MVFADRSSDYAVEKRVKERMVDFGGAKLELFLLYGELRFVSINMMFGVYG